MARISRKRARRNSRRAGNPVQGSPEPANKTPAIHEAGPSSGGQKIVRSLAHPVSTETPPVIAVSDSQPESSSNSFEDATRPTKKARLDSENSHAVSPYIMPHIFKLPLEILGEILVRTNSSRHVLAFVRTCKHFCYTLMSEGAQYIWRQARRGSQCSFLGADLKNQLGLGAAIISLPDPPKEFFSETAYAAFLFDPGACDTCGKETHSPYASFALRIRFCNNPSCRRLPTGLRDPEQFELIVPTNEKTEITALYNSHVVKYWPFTSHSYYKTLAREADIVKARKEFLTDSDGGNEKRLESLRSRNAKWMHFCSALAMWKTAFNDKYLKVKTANETVARHAADMFGCHYPDMIGCTVLGSFCQQQSRFLEKVDIQDIYRLRDQIEAELFALEDKRQRRKTEIALMKNREDVETLYNRLRSKNKDQCLPSLPTFRQLPIIQLLQAGIYEETRGTKIADTLQNNPLMRQRLDQEVKQWEETAKQDLAVVLGFPRQWKSANKHVLHPVKRSTAWFLCKECSTDGTSYKMDGSEGSLNFADACLHVCRGKDGKNDRFRRSKKAAWNPGNFIKDEKAINVMKSALAKQNLCEETPAGFFLDKHFVAIVCNSCEPSMVLAVRNMIGHCHRHENMELSFVSRQETISYLNGFAYNYGLVSKFFRRGRQAVQKEISKKNFGCRICLRRNQANETVVPGGSTNSIGNKHVGITDLVILPGCARGPRPKEMPPLFNFNGMRSHLKAKHGIENIRDEDFFCPEEVKL